MPPTNNPPMTHGLVMSICKLAPVFISATSLNDANNANVVSAADPIAKPFPIAAVVFPTASYLSVLSRTSGDNSAISAIPPALSEIGPYASTANCMPVFASIPSAAIAMPYRPENS